MKLVALRKKMQRAANLISLKLKAVAFPTDKRAQTTFGELRSTGSKIRIQRTLPDRRIARSENSQYYTIINSSTSRKRKADYLGQAILKAQSRVVTEQYW
jgi:hypothetical protein